MGLFTKKESVEKLPPFLPGTSKGETARYEASCTSIKSESCEIAGKVALRFVYSFEVVRTFPDGADVSDRYGIGMLERPTATVEMNTAENGTAISTLNKLLSWNGKEDAQTFRVYHTVVLHLTVMPPRRKEGQKGIWPGRVIVEDLDAMPDIQEIARQRAAADEIRRSLLPDSGDAEADAEADAETDGDGAESEGESEAGATPTGKPAKAKPAKSPAKSAR